MMPEKRDHTKRSADEIEESWKGVPSKHLSEDQAMVLKLLDRIRALEAK